MNRQFKKERCKGSNIYEETFTFKTNIRIVSPKNTEIHLKKQQQQLRSRLLMFFIFAEIQCHTSTVKGSEQLF